MFNYEQTNANPFWFNCAPEGSAKGLGFQWSTYEGSSRKSEPYIFWHCRLSVSSPGPASQNFRLGAQVQTIPTILRSVFRH
jgi:hypothetical protein